MMMLHLLATAATSAAASASDMNYVTTGAVAAVCSLVSGLVLYGKGKQSRSVTIDKQPVEIALQQTYVTRTEFAEFKGEMKSDMREIKGMFDKAITLITERDDRLTTEIGRVASGAYEARRRLHESVNAQGERIAAIDARTDVSKSIGKLGTAVLATLRKAQQANPPSQP